MKTNHKQTKIKIGKKEVKVDNELIELIKCLNKFGIKTTFCCKGEKRGYVSIDKKNIEFYSGVVNRKHNLLINLRFKTPKNY